MSKAKANVATQLLAQILGVVVDASSEKEVAALLKEAGLTVAGGKVVKADKGGKGAKGKKAKAPTAAQIVAAVKDEEELDISGVDEDTLREAVIKAKLSTKKKAGALDEDALRDLLNEAMGVESEDDEDEEDEDEDEDDSDDEDEDDDSDEDEDDEDDEDEDDSDDEDEDEDDEDEDDEDDDSVDLDNLDKDELLALVLKEKLTTAKKAKKMDEDDLRELLEDHFGGDDEDDEDEDEDDEDFDDEDEDEDDE